MRAFITLLERETNDKIRKIEKTIEMPGRSRATANVLESAFMQLKEFIISYRFKDEAEEILFFKEIKPRLFCRLIFHRKVYNIELNRPVGASDTLRNYFVKALDEIQEYRNKRIDFYRYWRSGASHMDHVFFLRGTQSESSYLDGFAFERDPLFSTPGDFTAAKILAGDMLQTYLLKEISVLERHPDSSQLPDVRPTWQDSKTELYEQLFAWHAKGSFGDIPLTRLAAYIQKAFNIELNGNLTRTFAEMRLRDTPTPYLDKLTDALLRKMRRNKKHRSKIT